MHATKSNQWSANFISHSVQQYTQLLPARDVIYYMLQLHSVGYIFSDMCMMK